MPLLVGAKSDYGHTRRMHDRLSRPRSARKPKPHTSKTLSGDVKAMFKHFQAELIGKIDFWSQSFSLTGSEKGSDGNFSIMGVL